MRDGAVSNRFFAKAPSSNRIPDKIVIDKSDANGAGIREMYRILRRFGCPIKVQTVRLTFLNSVIEQIHRLIKRRVRHMSRFKSLASSFATLDGIEIANITRKRKFFVTENSGFQRFAQLGRINVSCEKPSITSSEVCDTARQPKALNFLQRHQRSAGNRLREDKLVGQKKWLMRFKF